MSVHVQFCGYWQCHMSSGFKWLFKLVKIVLHWKILVVIVVLGKIQFSLDMVWWWLLKWLLTFQYAELFKVTCTVLTLSSYLQHHTVVTQWNSHAPWIRFLCFQNWALCLSAVFRITVIPLFSSIPCPTSQKHLTLWHTIYSSDCLTLICLKKACDNPFHCGTKVTCKYTC